MTTNIPSFPPRWPTFSPPIPRPIQTMVSQNLPSPYARPVPGFVAATLTSPCLISTKCVSQSRPSLTLFSPSRARSCTSFTQVLAKTRPLAGASSCHLSSCLTRSWRSRVGQKPRLQTRFVLLLLWCPVLLSKIIPELVTVARALREERSASTCLDSSERSSWSSCFVFCTHCAFCLSRSVWREAKGATLANVSIFLTSTSSFFPCAYNQSFSPAVP